MGRGVVLLLVCAVLLGAVIFTRPWEQETPPGTVTAPVNTGGQTEGESEQRREREQGDGRTVALGDTEVLVRYPEGYDLAADAAQLAESGRPQACSGGFDYCFYPSGESDAQSAADSAGLAVTSRQDLSSEADCVLEPTPAFADKLPTVGGGGDHATAHFGSIEESDEDTTTTIDLQRLYFDGTCFEFVSRVVDRDTGDPAAAQASGLASAQASGRASGEPPGPGDQQATPSLEQEIADIVGDVALPDGRSNLWAAGR